MTGALPTDGRELPSTVGVRTPRTRLLRTGRPVAAGTDPAVVEGRDPRGRAGPDDRAAGDGGQPRRLAGRPAAGDQLPAAGARADQAGDVRRTARPVLRASGQIELDRFHVDVAAIRSAVATLRAGQAVGVFPEGTRGAGDMTSPRAGAAYLALVTGAPVVPVSFLGTRIPGGGDRLVPPRGTRIAMTFGDPVDLGHLPWPRTQDQVDAASARRHRRDPADHPEGPGDDRHHLARSDRAQA